LTNEATIKKIDLKSAARQTKRKEKMKQFKFLILMTIMMVIAGSLFSANPAYGYTADKAFTVITDTGSDTDPADTYGTNKDGYASAWFRGGILSNKIFTITAATQDTISGTSATHLLPMLQISGDGLTWADVDSLSMSPTFTTGNANSIGIKWTMTASLANIYAPYVRVVYVIRTAGYANVSTAANLGGEQVMKTVIYVPR
jgi:hypothetical protein